MSSNRDIWVNRCRAKISSRFSLAQAAVLRWEQLLRGARPRITTENPKWMETPLREIATDAVTFDPEEFAVRLEGTPYEPPRPEPEDDLDDLLDLDLKVADAELDAGEVPAAEDKPATEDTQTVEAKPEPEDTEVGSVSEPVVAAAALDGADDGADGDGDPDTAGDGNGEKSETQSGDAL